MAATFSVERELPKPPSELYDVAMGDEFQSLRASELGGTAPPTVTPTSGRGNRVEMTRRIPPEKLPSAVRKFLPKNAAARQVDDWVEITEDGSRGTWTAEVPGAPVTIGGRYDVARTAGGSLFRVTGEVKVSIPVVGGKIANEVRKYIEELAVQELDLMERHLADLGRRAS